MTPHIEAGRGDYAETVLLPGDPERAQWMAERFLEAPRCVNRRRGALGFTGRFRGKPVSIQTTGIGVSSFLIYAHELLDYHGVKTLIRTGTCGGLSEEVRLRQVLTNLLGNAVKFTESGSIGLSVRPLADHPGRLHFRVEVSDTGIGISQGQMQRLFQPFVQADGSATRHYGGTGLGLAISRQLVQLMGGTIGVVSGATGGSTFWFELELEKIVPSPARPAGSNRPFADLNERLSGLKVLVVEDNASNQLVTRKLLECQGHRVTIATNGREALAALQRDSFDAILMDCQMPEMDGYTTTAKIRSGEVPGLDTRIPIIALTANALPSDRAKCLEAGMNDYLSKPVRPAELAASFHRCRLKSAAR